ncbi:hypothetical protein Gilli_1953 [Gillisia limnaea DSM 15749]|uniref:Uncharacterized protein n=1 Tax=Gillisia limnaea (strain DSM 15749 / LMG 21470 / R-8282) TaxID=865937 RepID=H2BT34_GILLR|nr:hypothetical protein Gilli_1953 [Gillisia limnaea DSM 15749]
MFGPIKKYSLKKLFQYIESYTHERRYYVIRYEFSTAYCFLLSRKA